MKIAAIVLVQAGYLGLAVCDGSPASLEIVDLHSLEVGHLEALEQRRESGQDKTRVLTGVESAELCDRVLSIVESHHCDLILIEAPSLTKSPLARNLFGSLCEGLNLRSLAFEAVFSGWRFRLGDPPVRRRNARELIARIVRDCSGLEYDSLLFATGLVVHHLVKDLDGFELDVSKPSRKSKPSRSESGAALDVQAPVKTSESTREEPTHGGTFIIEPPGDTETLPTEQPAPATIVAGVDVGTHWVGVVVASRVEDTIEAQLIKTLKAGRDIPLKKPRRIELAGGGQRVIESKHVLDFDDASAVADLILADLVRFQVSELWIEFVESVHIDRSDARSSSGVATELMKAMWIAVLLGERARCLGLHVHRVQAASWRAKMLGRKSDHGESPELIPEVLTKGFANWPPFHKTNVHEQDAGVVTLYGYSWLDIESAKKNKPEAPKPRKRDPAKKPKTTANTTRDRHRAEIRAAAGCECRRKHVSTCPLYRPAKLPDWVRPVA